MANLGSALTRSAVRVPGAIFIVSAAVLWGMDGLFRRNLAQELSASTIVFNEHVILVLVVVPILPRVLRSAWRVLDWKGWLSVVLVGAGASALATVLFTEAFGRGDPITPLVLQKLQPFIVVAGAWFLLRERLRERYWIYFIFAVAAAWFLTFPDPFDVQVEDATTSLLAVGAAALWGMGTVLGRDLSTRLKFEEVATLRFAFGLPASLLLVSITDSAAFVPRSDFGPIVAMALVTGGFIALLLYYFGMQRTPASVATLAELAFPATAAVVGYLFLDGKLTGSQWAGGIALCGTVALMSLQSARGTRAVGVQLPKDIEMVLTQAEGKAATQPV